MKSGLWLAIGLLAAMTPVLAADVTFELVDDLDTTPVIGRSDPHYLRQVDGLVYFSATTPERGAELYATDGTNMQFVHEFAAGTVSSFPKVMGRAGGRLIVEADDGVQGAALFALDRASGAAERLQGFGFAGTGDYRFAKPLLQLADHLLYVSQQQLYTTDGTAAGTGLLSAEEHYGRIPGDSVCAVAGGALFVSRNANLQPQIRRTDGNAANNVVVATLTQESRFVAASGAGGQCYFLFRRELGWSLWRSSGGAVSLVAQQSNAAPRTVAAAAAGQFAYIIDGSSTMFRLWHTGSSLPVVTYPLEMQNIYARAVGSRLVFDAPYVADGNRLYGVFVSDGTAAGTVRVAGLSHTMDIDQTDFVIGDVLLFGGGSALGRLDVATATVSWVNVGPENPGFDFSSGIAPLGGVLLAGNHDRIWRSDGTATGTVPLHTPWWTTMDSAGYYPRSLSIGDVLFYMPGTAWQTQSMLWRTDGSAAGTRALPVGTEELHHIDHLARLGSDLLLSGPAPVGSGQLVYRVSADFSSVRRVVDNARYPGIQSNGEVALMGCSTASGFYVEHHLCALRANESTAAIIAPRLQDDGVYEPAGRAGQVNVFFKREPGATSLWRSDGTAPGTFPLMTTLNLRGSFPAAHSFGDQLLLDGCDVAGRCGLFATDGSVAGTRLVAEVQPIREFHTFGTRVIFSTGFNASADALWITDLTAAGTRLVRDQAGGYVSPAVKVGNRLHFTAATATVGQLPHYFVSDGSAEGTQEVVLPETMRPGALLAAVDADTVVFACHFPETGWEPCLIDASGTNPRLGRDLFPGPENSMPVLLGQTANATYLSVDDGRHGREPWRVLGDRVFAGGFE